MISKKQQVILKMATFKNTVFLGLILLTMGLFIMPEATREIERCSNGVKKMDGLRLFSPDEAYATISSYGGKGRQLYIAVAMSAVLFFAIIISLFLCSLLVWSGSVSGQRTLKWRIMAGLPLLTFLFICMENAGTVWMLRGYPTKYFFLSVATSSFTVLKLASISACFYFSTKNLVVFGLAKRRTHTATERKTIIAKVEKVKQ